MRGVPGAQNGWGLTETSPVLACRRLRERENVRGTVGLPMPGTQVRVVDPETRADLPDGQQARRHTLAARRHVLPAGFHRVRDHQSRAGSRSGLSRAARAVRVSAPNPHAAPRASQQAHG